MQVRRMQGPRCRMVRAEAPAEGQTGVGGLKGAQNIKVTAVLYEGGKAAESKPR